MPLNDTKWGKIGRGPAAPFGAYFTRNLHGYVLSIFKERTMSVPASAHDFVRPVWRWVGYRGESGSELSSPCVCQERTLRAAKAEMERDALCMLNWIESEGRRLNGGEG